MSEPRTYKRKLLNFSINRDMQLKMIGKIFLILFVSLLLSGLIFYQFANQEITSSFKMFHIKAQNFLDFLMPVVISSFLISLVAGVIGSLFFPKPIAGGLYRIEEDLKKATDENDWTTEIRLRGGDQLIPIAQRINRLLSDGRNRFETVREALEKLENADVKQMDNEKLQEIRDLLKQAQSNLKI